MACSGDVSGEVCKQYECSGTSCIQTYKLNCCGNKQCERGENCATCPSDCSCTSGKTCKNSQCIYEQTLENGEVCTIGAQCISNYCNNGYCCAAGTCCRKNTECASGQICSSSTCQTPGAKCSDGSAAGNCSAIKPKFCNNGNFVYACATCGCPEGDICTINGLCSKLQCSDGTTFNSCSNSKPQFCSEGILLNNCSKCGCPAGLLCDRSSQFCYERPVITIISPHEDQTINVGDEKKVVISGVVSKGSREVNTNIEGNDSRFILATYEPYTGEFSFENISPIDEGPSSIKISVADNDGNLLKNESRSFKVLYAPAGMTDLFSLQSLGLGIVQLTLLLFFLAILLNALMPVYRSMRRGMVSFPEGSIILVEGAVGSGKEEFCLEVLRDWMKGGKFGVVLSYDPSKEEKYFWEWEKRKLLFTRVEPDINEIALSVSKALGAKPKALFFNIINLLIPKYNAEELTDFLNTNFVKLRNAKCGAVFCVDRGVAGETISAIEGLFDGVVEFRVQEEKGRLKSYFRIKEFKLKKFDTEWRRFK